MAGNRKKICINFDKSGMSFQSCVVQPRYLSAGKLCEKNKPRKLGTTWEMRSAYPLRENIWEYLNEDKDVNFRCTSKRTKRCKQTGSGGENNKMWAVLLLIIAGVVMMSYSRVSDFITQSRFITKVLPKTRLISLLHMEQPVDGECCHVMKSLAASLLRAELALRNTQRIRSLMVLSSRASKSDVASPYERDYISDATVMRGSDTREWGARVALWGLLPLWRAGPPLATVLAARKPVPADCWPFSGSRGELIIELPQDTEVRCVSIEHVRPDTAKSAPRNFVLYGILENGTWIKSIEAEYRNQGPAKQFFEVTSNATLQRMALRILSNHGNPKYTCVYRVHLYRKIE